MGTSLNFTKNEILAIEEEHALRHFLEVSAPDRDCGNLYYNDKGEGLLETFPNSSEFHKHEDEGKISFTTDRGEVFKVAKIEPYILSNQKRLAQNEEDFQEVYDREFKHSGLEDNEEEHIHFKQNILPRKVNAIVEIHSKRVGDTKINASLTFLANRFLNFIKGNSRELVRKKTKESKTLQNLFINKEEYPRIIEALVKDGILLKNGDHLSLNNSHLQDNRLSEKRAICAFGFLLDRRNFIKCEDNQLAESLSSLFQIEITKQAYSEARRGSFVHETDKAKDYFALYYRMH